MSRKTLISDFVAIAATLGITIAVAETSGANAQQSAENDVSAAAAMAQPAVASAVTPVVTEETVPVFVSNEVVQPLPEADETAVETVSNVNAASLAQLVQQIDTSADLSEEMHCLAGTVYFESRGEPLAGQLAVAQVVINRAESSTFPSSYCGVVYQRAQFSFVKNGNMPRIRKGSTAWQRAKAIARIAHEGQWESEAQDSLYFHAKYVKPRWSYRKQRRAAINTHIFYR